MPSAADVAVLARCRAEVRCRVDVCGVCGRMDRELAGDPPDERWHDAAWEHLAVSHGVIITVDLPG